MQTYICFMENIYLFQGKYIFVLWQTYIRFMAEIKTIVSLPLPAAARLTLACKQLLLWVPRILLGRGHFACPVSALGLHRSEPLLLPPPPSKTTWRPPARPGKGQESGLARPEHGSRS